MKIHLESLGLPTLAAIIGKKAEVDLEGETIADLIAFVASKHGHKAKQILLDSDGRLDLTIQVMLNDEGFVRRDDLEQRVLKEGDRVKLMLLAGGG